MLVKGVRLWCSRTTISIDWWFCKKVLGLQFQINCLCKYDATSKILFTQTETAWCTIKKLFSFLKNLRSVCSHHHIWFTARQHYSDVIMGATASQTTSLTIVYATVYSGAYQRKHQSSAWPLWGNSPVTGEFPAQRPVTRKKFPFDDVIMECWVKCPQSDHLIHH